MAHVTIKMTRACCSQGSHAPLRAVELQVYLSSQCTEGTLNPELYRSGQVALSMGVEAGPRMTPECAVVKMMQCLRYPAIPLGVPLAGEM